MLLCAYGAVAADFKMNEYKDTNCQVASYTHSRASIFCGDIDGTTHSLYINPSSKSKVQFWSGPGCGGTFLYERAVSKSGECVKINGDEHSMGFA
ncbi:hypothetical protein M422DRAFT_39127 [Sphaerobolus stellatus SS14]|uniref:Unplaced genomic scaffold SPHSTscaffold_401, whole genome shotgun sequence n=1 Tax=Sphaerobolus stellatus (strain SS14) TaxID=990650 RepID=A0A0C9UDG3_SPHS4|nr:hypothetical protein M422DRAFT_39613 [Sphaerobolus stellatus SS14]KIJ24566.1 hypothetical protein M422DRAFT_39126 [Sphaerobolus stellatus SS14]KIJ24567.1 hypothetical protein M422DRAFT_39127 [Sphaerobolus stellatus SS14]